MNGGSRRFYHSSQVDIRNRMTIFGHLTYLGRICVLFQVTLVILSKKNPS